MEYAPLTELIGFDVILLGFLTLLASCIARELWLSGPTPGFGTLRQGWRRFVDFLGGVIETEDAGAPGLGEGPGNAKKSEVAKLVPLIGMVSLAGLLGMVMNIIGDSALDLPTVPGLAWNLSLEDRIKFKVLGSISEDYDAPQPIKEYLADQTRIDPAKGIDEVKAIDRAKAFFQHAYARTLRSSDVSSVLRYEFQAVKVLRVLFVETMIIFIAAAVGYRRNRSRDAPEKLSLKLRVQLLWGVLKIFLPMALLPCLFLLLWYTQVKRYDKRIVHSYLVLSEEKEDANRSGPAGNSSNH